MRLFGIVFLLIGVTLGGATIISAIKSNYEWDRDYGSLWSLADKSSTLADKHAHIDKFVIALEGAGLGGRHDAAFFKTNDNAFDANLAALKTLRGRLSEMGGMDANSMAYQQAMQQVTAQEQGEAHAMIGVLSGCWVKEHYPLAWGWWAALAGVFSLVMLFVGGVLLVESADA